MKYTRFLVALLGYGVLTLCIHIAHNRLLSVDVVLYSAIHDALLGALIMASLLFTAHYFKSAFSHFERLQILLICLLGGYIFAISVPTVIDRSLSMYILEKLQQRGGAIRLSAFEQVFTQEYVKEHRLVDVRITEQAASGTITVDHGCVRLTPRGERIATFTRFYRQNLLPRQRLLMGQYSDALTDPFRHQDVLPDYGC